MTTEVSELLDRIKKALASQKQRTVTVLSSLLAVEDELGYIPIEAIKEVASFQGVTINDVWGVASFYTNFRFQPPGTHVIELCWGPTCHIAGAMAIVKETLDTLKLSTEGETVDGRFSIKYNTCLGACSQAPVIMVDHRVMGKVTLQALKEMLSQFKGEVH